MKHDPSRSAPRVGTLITKSEFLKTDLKNSASRAHQPSSFWTRKSNRPVAGHTGQCKPGVSLIGSPCRSSRIGRDHHSGAVVVSFLSLSLSFMIAAVADRPHVTQAENRTGDRRRVRKLPRLTAIVRRGGSSVIRVAWIQIAAAYDAMPGVTEIHREGARAGRTDKRRVIRVPRVAPVSGAEDPGDCRAAGRNPGVALALGRNASAARRERRFARQRRRHIAADVLPGLAIGGAEIGEHSVHRVAMRDAALRRPERETIVERAGILVLELHRPSRAAIYRFIYAEVRRIIPDGLQVGDLIAHALHIAELQRLGSRHNSGFPGFSPVGRQKKRAPAPGRPDHARVNRTDRNQPLRSAAVLRSQFGLMNFLVRFRKAQGRESKGSNQENGQGTVQHSNLSGGKLVACGWSIRPRRKGCQTRGELLQT